MELKKILTVIMMTILMFANVYYTGVSATATFGGCVAGKESCKDCYLTLIQELFKRDDNVFNLSTAFFPPELNPPEFVRVTYIFADNGVTNETQTWYWVGQSSYFLFPPNTFQFLSLFFGKPEEYYAQEVTVTLNATDCLGVDKEHLTLLTQRLKAFIQRNTFHPILDNTYSAKAGQSLADILDETRTNDIINIIFVYQAFIWTVIIVLVLTVPCLSNYHKDWYSKLTQVAVNKKPKPEAFVTGIATICAILTVYIIILDVLSGYYNYRDSSVSAVVNLVVFHMPAMVIVGDVCFIFCFLFIVSVISRCKCCMKHNSFKKLKEKEFKCKECIIGCLKCCESDQEHYTCNIGMYDFAIAITFFSVALVINHLPFIIIAYLNDAYHAGSTFIFYVFSSLLLLSVVEISVYILLRKIIGLNFTNKNGNTIKILCEGSNISFIKQSDLKEANQELDSAKVENDTVAVDNKFKLKFETATEVTVSDFNVTLLRDKVKKGTLFYMQIKLKNSDDLDKFIKQYSILPSNKEFVVELELKLMLNKKHQISAQGKCKYESFSFKTQRVNKQGIIVIDDIEFINQSDFPSLSKQHLLIVILVMFLLIVFTLAGIVFTATYLVVIPINRSISDAPNRLIGIYQTIFLLLGIYIGYKTFFKRKITLESVVETSEKNLSVNKEVDDNRWLLMSNEEKLAEFYKTKAEMIKSRAENP